MTARELALRVLIDLDDMRKSEEVLNRLFEHSGLERTDRALVKELVAGTLKYQMQCDFIINHFYRHDYAKAAPILKHILRLGVYQLLHLDRIPGSAAVNESVKLARKYKGEHLSRLVNGVLRKISRETVDLEKWTTSMSESRRLSILYSFPEWLVTRWLSAYGRETAEKMLAHANLPPSTACRINSLRSDPDTFFKTCQLADAKRIDGIDGLDRFFFLNRFAQLEPLLTQGVVSIQNPTQGVACLLAQPKPDDTILDLCAAPGGKSTFMAELMDNRGRIIALDRSAVKVERMVSNVKALGITIIEGRVGDALIFDPECSPDIILLDAPCTGTGALGRRAELRWRTTPEKLKELVELQSRLLDRAAELLAPGGTLLYSTCSVEPEENALQADGFLLRNPAFTSESSVLTLPGSREGFDGGYAIRFRKKGAL